MPEITLDLEHPIFIVGCPRSGTTKLAAILNKHSNLASATETHFFNFVSKQKYNWSNFSTQDLNRFLEEARILDFTKLANIQAQDLVQQFETREDLPNSEASLEDFNKKMIFNLLVKNYLLKKNKSRFCEKTPQHIQNVAEILRIYPHAKIILMIRDGRDTVNSLLKMPWRPKGLLNNARFWSNYIKIGKRESLRPEVLTIKYENLLERPRDVLQSICNFLGESFEESLLDDSREPDNLFSAWEASWKNKSKQELDITRINAWTRELSQDDQIILDWLLHKDLIDLGYHSDLPKLKLRHYVKLCIQSLNIAWKKMTRIVAHILN
jgi:Sulfotransferase family